MELVGKLIRKKQVVVDVVRRAWEEQIKDSKQRVDIAEQNWSNAEQAYVDAAWLELVAAKEHYSVLIRQYKLAYDK